MLASAKKSNEEIVLKNGIHRLVLRDDDGP
jgi:hypothetical protein